MIEKRPKVDFDSLPVDRQVEVLENQANLIYKNVASTGSDQVFIAKTLNGLDKLAEKVKDNPALLERVRSTRALIAPQERKEAA